MSLRQSRAKNTEKTTKKPYIPTLSEGNVRQGFFERREFEMVSARLLDYLKPPILFAYQVGWRLRSEVFPLTWAQVDLETGTVRLEVGASKTGGGRTIYLPEALREVLEEQWRDHIAHYPACSSVFYHRGKPIKSSYGAWRKACQEAGLAGKIPHDFRRTAVRNMVRAGIPERVAMQISGHKTRSIFDRYHIVSDGDLKEAAKRLDAAFTLQTTTLPLMRDGDSPLTH